MKRPSFQFYPSDWLRDTALRSCSGLARGLWIDMICYMHEGSPYGYLKVGNKVILPSNLSLMTGLTLHEVETCLKELHDAGVYNIDDSGAIFSRRMIRDENIRNSRAKGGSLGGNPALINGGKVNLSDNLHHATKDNLKLTPSSSSSSSLNKRTLTSSKKNDENEILEVTEKQGKKRASQLPDKWQPSDGLKERWLGRGFTAERISSELEKFDSYYQGKGLAMADWEKSFNGWLLKAREIAPKQSFGQPTQPQQAFQPAPTPQAETIQIKPFTPEWEVAKGYFKHVDSSKYGRMRDEEIEPTGRFSITEAAWQHIQKKINPPSSLKER